MLTVLFKGEYWQWFYSLIKCLRLVFLKNQFILFILLPNRQIFCLWAAILRARCYHNSPFSFIKINVIGYNYPYDMHIIDINISQTLLLQEIHAAIHLAWAALWNWLKVKSQAFTFTQSKLVTLSPQTRWMVSLCRHLNRWVQGN